MKLSTILFITFFAINSNAQDNYQFIGKVVDEKKQRVNDVDIYLSSHNISCQVLSNGQFICENSVPFKPNDILLLHFNKNGYKPISLPPTPFGTGNLLNPVQMEKTEKHYITIITKENTEPVKIVENAKIGFNDKMYQTNEFGISIIEIKNLEVIEGQNPFTLGIKKEGYEDIVFEREFYNKRGKIKIITLRKKQKRIPNITITTKIEGTPNIINSEIGQFINGEKIIKNK